MLPTCGGVVLDIESWEAHGWDLYGGINSPCLAIYDMTPLTLAASDSAHEFFSISDTGIYRLRLQPEDGEQAYSASLEVVP
jgi:hypothetical protein